MALRKSQRVLKAFRLLVLVSTFGTTCHSFVEGTRYKGLKHKGTIKTIVDPEDNVVIDCVDFYKQPTFDDPRFKSLQVDRSYFPGETKIKNEDLKKSGLYQNWRKYGECPTATIPIRRIQNRESRRKRWMFSNGKFYNHEYAIVKQRFGKYYGGRAEFNVWQPRTEERELSITQIWLGSGEVQKLNTLEAGWMVYPEKYGDARPTSFIYWTADYYNKTGCYNLECPGFIQTFAGYAIGVPFHPSIYNDINAVYEMGVEIYHHQNGPFGNWILKLNDQQIGYWPSGTFGSLTYGADIVHWGGEILNLKPAGYHTTTEMGSGHFPVEGFTRASYVKKLAIMNTEKDWVDVDEIDLASQASRPECYDVKIPSPTDDLGTHFFYGGPGYSMKCKE